MIFNMIPSFFVEPWRPCMLADYRDTCGRGVQVRIVYCVSSVGEVLQDSDCTQEKPLIERQCKVCLYNMYVFAFGAKGALRRRGRYVKPVVQEIF